MLAEKEKLRGCLIKLIVKTIEDRFAPATLWSAKPLKDGILVVTFPLLELAREIEQMCEIKLLGFFVHFAPWTADLDSSEKAFGELRWISGHRLPLLCQNRDTVVRILKPVGDLVYLNGQGDLFVNQLQIMKHLKLKAFRTHHVIPSQGYLNHSMKQKLKLEYAGNLHRDIT
ncbi:hypothetical protein J5N97_018356 [Dioscorea zingiberensis]|uniref:Uncharacterized protein n=1 Tax=Dioscorea zingiberensis TaxID=325984 RepID=A0A9D5CN14_9LILI|nr:hypothetical protein J5N97_018356 [Dioscorea zingiberensis]